MGPEVTWPSGQKYERYGLPGSVKRERWNLSMCIRGGTRQRSWLRHYATSRKVAGSSPDEVDFFNWSNPSSRTMALGSTQPLTDMSTRNLPVGKGQPARKADNLTAICELTKCGSLDVSHPDGPSRHVTGIAFFMFNDTVNNSHYTASNDWITSE
jgi:hypothetical protein